MLIITMRFLHSYAARAKSSNNLFLLLIIPERVKQLLEHFCMSPIDSLEKNI